MQLLKLADDLFPALRDGAKLCTIRAGKRDVVPGGLVFESVSGDQRWNVYVKRVAFCTVANLTLADARKDGFDTVDALFDGLRRFYPDLGAHDLVTIIDFE